MSRNVFSALCALSLIASACDATEIRVEPDLAPGHGPAAEESDLEARAGTCATLFEHVDYGGDRRDVQAGESVDWIGGPWNDHVSSMTVRSGCVFNAYEHKDHDGQRDSFSGDVPWVGNWWNDRISSYTCTC